MEEDTGEAFTDTTAALEKALRESREECLRLQDALAAKNGELQQRGAQMKRAEQLARIGYWHDDLRRGKVLWSEGLSSLLGFPAAAQTRAEGEIYDYIVPEDRAAVYQAIDEAARGKGTYQAEFRARDLDGELHHVRILGEIEFDHGKPVANFGVGQDVTTVKRIEAALRDSDLRSRRQARELELIYATAPVGLCVLDDQLRFVHVNECLAAVNGIPASAHLGRTVWEVVPDIARRGGAALQRVLETGKPVTDFELSGETPAQPGVQRTWLSQYWPLLDDDGKVLGINVVVEEITERKRLEESRRAEQEFRALAEHATDLITRFDRSLRRVYVNPAVEKVLGRPRSELLGRRNEEIGLSREMVALWNSVFERAFRTGEIEVRESIIRTPAGEIVLETHVIPERGPDGGVSTLLAVSRDVTERNRFEMALQESEERYRRQASELETIYRYAPVGLTVLDTHLRYLRVNERLAELNGVAPAEHIGRTVAEVVPSLAAHTETIVRRVIASGEAVNDTEMRGETRARPGMKRIWNVQWVPLKEADGTVWGINVVVEEITERKRAEEVLFRREQEFEALAERAPDIIARYDRRLKLLYVNPAVERITGKPRNWFLGRTPSEMELPPRETEMREEVIRRMLEGGREQTVEHEYQTTKGTRYFQSRLVPEFGPGGGVDSVLVVDRDITDLKRAHVALEELTLHDPLTGIANRRYLTRFIEREWRREVRHHHSVAIVMADIDFFKAYNDRYGHQRGDECLRQVADTLQVNLRRPTDILVRYGGEEFAVVLLESDLAAATRLAESMHGAVAARRLPHEASPVAPVVTISLGVTAAPANRLGFEDLLDAADQALYRAKHNGRNRVEAVLPPVGPAWT